MRRGGALRALAARKSNSQVGLRVVVRRADHERPLCGEIEGSDVLKELPKFSLGSYAHSSIRVQEGQRISEVFKAKGASDFKVVKRCRDQRDSNLACVIDSSNFFRSPA